MRIAIAVLTCSLLSCAFEAARGEETERLARRERMEVAGGQLLSSAFSFLSEMLPDAPAGETVSRVGDSLKAQLAECMSEDEQGRPQLKVTLPDRAALDALAISLAKLVTEAAADGERGDDGDADGKIGGDLLVEQAGDGVIESAVAGDDGEDGGRVEAEDGFPHAEQVEQQKHAHDGGETEEAQLLAPVVGNLGAELEVVLMHGVLFIMTPAGGGGGAGDKQKKSRRQH